MPPLRGGAKAGEDSYGRDLVDGTSCCVTHSLSAFFNVLSGTGDGVAGRESDAGNSEDEYFHNVLNGL